MDVDARQLYATGWWSTSLTHRDISLALQNTRFQPNLFRRRRFCYTIRPKEGKYNQASRIGRQRQNGNVAT
jgi:hypothetical protein